MSSEEEKSWDDIEEESGFVEDMPEDFYAAEELALGPLSKCRGGGKRKRKLFDRIIEQLEKSGKKREETRANDRSRI